MPEKKIRGVYEDPKGSGEWWIQYFDPRSKNARGRIRERVGRKSDAIRLYQKRKTEILQGKKLPELNRKRTTFGELIDRMYEATKHHKSARDYIIKGELAREVFGSRAAEEIGADELLKWIGKRKRSQATFNRYRSCLSLIFKQAGKHAYNPALDLDLKKEPAGRIRFLDTDEYKVIHAALVEEYPDRIDAFEFSVAGGPRLSEQFNLEKSGCNFKVKLVTFVDTKNGETRVVPMNDAMERILRRRITKEMPGKAKVFGDLHDFCIKTERMKEDSSSHHGTPYWFTEICKDQGIDDYTWHNNRHTFCSWHAMAGTPIPTLQKLAGHKSITITMRYAHLSPSHLREESNRLQLPGSKPKKPKKKVPPKVPPVDPFSGIEGIPIQ